MKFPLRGKNALLFLVIAIAGFALIATWGTSLAHEQVKNNTINEISRDAGYLAASYKANTGSINRSQLEGMAYSTGCDIWLMAISGKIEAFAGTVQPPESVPEFNPTDGKSGFYMTGHFYGNYENEMLSVYLPLTRNIATRGYVIMHYPLSMIDAAADRQMIIAYVVFGVLLAIFGTALLIQDLYTVQRIRKVNAAAMEYANGNLTYPLDVKGSDEITSLAMAEMELAKQIGSAAEDQHRFLANISHDFRSPLTSIKGYMVAIQDGVIPPEMQGKYIDVVINEADRLTKLANSLLDMTQLENGIILDKSDFDINDLIRNILPTFEGRVAEKNLSFNITFEEEMQPVHADRSRIQQVIYNLVDNAIKFSNLDSTVDIATHLHGDKVFVSVTDHGVGIEKENLNKIWERFYKTDASRGKDKKGTGLGLAIVREIIQAHKENIDVISTPGVGTEFIFKLPAA